MAANKKAPSTCGPISGTLRWIITGTTLIEAPTIDETPVAMTAKSPICRIRVGLAAEVFSGMAFFFYPLRLLKVRIRFRFGKRMQDLLCYNLEKMPILNSREPELPIHCRGLSSSRVSWQKLLKSPTHIPFTSGICPFSEHKSEGLRICFLFARTECLGNCAEKSQAAEHRIRKSYISSFLPRA